MTGAIVRLLPSRLWLPTLSLVLSLAVPLPTAGRCPAGELYVSHHESVLGTSLELRMIAQDQATAAQAEERALAEIDRLAGIFSTYDPGSEFSRWQQEALEPTAISPELITVLAAADTWREATGGAFHPGAQILSTLWKQAEQEGALPTGERLAGAAAELKTIPWRLDLTTGRGERVGRYPLTLNAIAKGYIIDRASQSMQAVPGVSAAFVKIGGDLRVAGAWQQPILIRNPGGAARQSQELQIEIADRGVATSGNAYRGFEIGGRRYSHILDPRTGWPVDEVVSATVVAPTAMDADALATAFSVLAPRDSLRLARSLEGVECLLIDKQGERFTSDGWRLLEVTSPATAGLLAQARSTSRPEATRKSRDSAPKKAAADWNGGFEMEVKLQINNAGGGRRYRRPYVAVWIEDADGFPVRTLALWVQSTGKGPRWIPGLKRWYKTEPIRKFNDETDLVATVSEPTRKPGEYSLIWDGTDNHGDLLEAGEYTVSIEAVREHGSYQIIRQKVMLDREAFAETLEGNTEIKAVSLEYRKRKSDDNPR